MIARAVWRLGALWGALVLLAMTLPVSWAAATAAMAWAVAYGLVAYGLSEASRCESYS